MLITKKNLILNKNSKKLKMDAFEKLKNLNTLKVNVHYKNQYKFICKFIYKKIQLLEI